MRNRIRPIQKIARRTLALALALSLCTSAATLAAGPLKGKTYGGKTSPSGVNGEGQSQSLSVVGISIRVAASGKSVKVRFTSSEPIVYCVSRKQIHVQSTKPASISRSGKFRATVDERFAAGPGASSIVLVVTGQFSGRSVSGKIQTKAGECGGSTTFSAKAR
jgi:hypothetical protein